MLAQAKLYILAFFSVVVTGFITWFKIRGNKIDELNEKLKHKTAEIKTQKAKDKVTQEIDEEYEIEKKIIEDRYEEKKKQVYDKGNNDNPLSASSLELLNNRSKKRVNTTSN